MTGKLAAQQAYFQGKLKVQGNMGLAMKLSELMKSQTKLQSKLWAYLLQSQFYILLHG